VRQDVTTRRPHLIRRIVGVRLFFVEPLTTLPNVLLFPPEFPANFKENLKSSLKSGRKDNLEYHIQHFIHTSAVGCSTTELYPHFKHVPILFYIFNKLSRKLIIFELN
jgi:hypothetical protein